MKFNKTDGLRLNKFECDTKGKLAGSLAFTNVSPGVDLEMGYSRAIPKGKKEFADSAYSTVSYNNDMVCFNGKLDVLSKTFTMDTLVGYENFLAGFNVVVDPQGEKTLSCIKGALGMNMDANRFVLEACCTKAFTFSAYTKPAAGVEVSFVGNAKPKKDSEDFAVDTTLAAKFALDNSGTSLTSTVKATPLDRDTFSVGLSYVQNLRSWAKLKLSGEVGIIQVDKASFGAELEVGDL